MSRPFSPESKRKPSQLQVELVIWAFFGLIWGTLAVLLLLKAL